MTSFENRLEERCLNFDLVLNILIRELLMNNLFLVKLGGGGGGGGGRDDNKQFRLMTEVITL